MTSKDFEKLMSTKDGKPVEIPLNGSISLLALGDLGLIAWRLKKQEYNQALRNKQNNREDEG